MVSPPSSSADPQPPVSDDALFSAIRAILLSQERDQLEELERRLDSYRQRAESQDDELYARIRGIVAEVRALWETSHTTETNLHDLQANVDLLRRRAQADSEGLIARIEPVLSDLVGRTVRDSPQEIAEAIGPVMGEAIRVQIRDSRDDMVEALYPIIGQTVQKAVAEFTQEIQRNIDRQLRQTFGPKGFLRRLLARLRGVDPAELLLRDSLPFSIQEIFVIQRGSGLLVAHSHPGMTEMEDADQIAGMLTAIRDFVRDSFAGGTGDDELEEAQYGDYRIIIRSGRVVYVAVVITGVEPEGFHAHLRELVSELHARYEKPLRDFSGDSATLPNLVPRIARFVLATTGETKMPLTRRAKVGIGCGVIAAIALLVIIAFYVRFTIALYPVAFPSPTPTNTTTPTNTSTPTNTPTATPTHTATPPFTATPTSTPTATYTPTSTSTPTVTYTPSVTPTATLTPTPPDGAAAGHVWVRHNPTFADDPFAVLTRDSVVTVISVYGDWVEIEWVSDNPWRLGKQRGWVPSQWVQILTVINPEVITATPTP